MTTPDLPPPVRRLYQVTSVMWMLYACALGLSTYGSQLLAAADPGRYVIAAASALVAVGMLLRAFVPGRPEWTRWTLPTMGTLGISTCALSFFAIGELGPTTGRVGYALLLAVPALFAYLHWAAERVVNLR